MPSDGLSESGIHRIATYSPYLDVLADLANEMGLRQRGNLMHIEKCLHDAWDLGANSILSWAECADSLCILVVPHYALAEYTASPAGGSMPWRPSETFITRLISGDRHLPLAQLNKVARLLGVEPVRIALREPLSGERTETLIIEKMVKRYGINHVPRRAVALFDIVGFSLLTPFEQMTQLNSLSYSLNAAHSKMLERKIGVNFARSTTGDGFYIWNRDQGHVPNANLYHFMQLVLADNAIAHRKAVARSVPSLRTAFHVGSCYEFHQADGLNPTIHDYIVGDVTIELARMIERALPGQIFVGDFDLVDSDDDDDGARTALDSIQFIDFAQQKLSQLTGIELSGERVSSIKCYLTGERHADGHFSIRKLQINDKHGLTRYVFNAKVNIHRENAEPILLGIEDRKLRAEGIAAKTAELVHTQPEHHA